MSKNILFWVLSIVITIVIVIYQRATGPTYPVKGVITVDEAVGEKSKNTIEYKLLRSHGGDDDHTVSIHSQLDNLQATLVWKRYKTNDDWTYTTMKKNSVTETYEAILPHQPPAGKLEYFIEVTHNDKMQLIPNDRTIVIRFKGAVPTWVLITHIIAMFGAMILATRTGLEVFRKEHKVVQYTWWTVGFLAVGGFFLGPLMQLYAFGAWWTGFPFGHDLTDNKTLIAMVGWIIAIVMYRKSKHPARWALFAAILMFITYLIPHSVMGSELDYNKLDAQKKQIELTK